MKQQKMKTETEAKPPIEPEASTPEATAEPPAEAPTNGNGGTPATDPQAALATTDGDGKAISAFSSHQAFIDAQRMAKALSCSSLVPKEYQGNIPNVLIALELANRVGASVFMIMQNLDIIHGRPSWRSQFLIATVNSSGRFTPLRFRWSGEEGTDSWGCRAYARDKQTGEECVGALITIALAKAEGWHEKPGSKWKTMPEQMLMYRAGGFWTRVYAPELSLGLQTAEEAADVHAPDAREVPRALQPGDPQTLEAELLEGEPAAKAS